MKVCVLVIHGLTERDVVERDRFWSDLNKVVDRVSNGYRLCVIDLNGWMGWIE